MIEIIPNFHPLLVHFTIALLSVSIVFFVIQKPLYETEIGDNFNVFARYSLFLGVFITILTLLAGWDAYNSVDHDTPSHIAMKDHRLWAFITFGVFALAALWLAFSSAMRETASVAFIIVLLIGGGLLMTTGYKGAELVYKHGLGVQSLPKAEGHDHASGHDHDHGDAKSKSHDEAAPHAHEEAEHAHEDAAHSHGEAAHGHGEASSEMKIDAQSIADMEMGMDSAPAVEPQTAPVVDKDGISKQALPAEEMPAQAAEEAPHDDGHDHQH